MDVLFEVAGAIVAKPEADATILAENLHLKAAGQLGDEGIEGAAAVAATIEAVLTGEMPADTVIPLEGLAADAVYAIVRKGIDPAEPLYRALYAQRHDSH